jgi:copper chaperone CopZ
MATVKRAFTIDGMHCGSCAVSIGMILRTVTGVKSAHADFDTKIATVEYDDAVASPEAMNKAIQGLGYQVKDIAR